MVQGKVTLREISRKLEMEFNQKDEWVVKALEKSAPTRTSVVKALLNGQRLRFVQAGYVLSA
jgi:hypothetical protein